ncbi:hypothetical protein M0811_07338 [Anaeramoeba ignava]|uniref:Uncharacterized protein n=1 Tax=Anaeramoeba ignava TaxID=1746090 RepID=A0A9Q0LPY2_ANAIG|nr:hypothetical protein M0811_07338 [Anaeramoeba ignava]
MSQQTNQLKDFSAIKTGFASLYIISIIFFLVSIFSLIELFRNLRYYRWFRIVKRAAVFRIGILFLAFWLMLERGLNNLIGIQINDLRAQFFFAFSLPAFLQFLIFLFLMWFLLSVTQLAIQSDAQTKKIDIVFTSFTILGGLLCILSVILIPKTPPEYYHMMIFFVSLFFLLLIFTFIGPKVIKSLGSMGYKTLGKKRINMLMALILLDFCVFLIGAVFDLLNIFIKSMANWFEASIQRFSIFYCIWSLIFDIIPTLIFIICLHLDFSKNDNTIAEAESKPLIFVKLKNRKPDKKISELNALLEEEDLFR